MTLYCNSACKEFVYLSIAYIYMIWYKKVIVETVIIVIVLGQLIIHPVMHVCI